MRDLITADLQLTDHPRDRNRHEFMRQLPQLARDYECERVIILGDLTEEKDRHPAVLVNQIVDHFLQLARVARIIFLRGNHDYVDVEHPFFDFLRQFEAIRFITAPTKIGRDLFLPHTDDYKRDWKDLELSGYERIFCHNTFTGAVATNGHALKGIPIDVFPRGAWVIAGDVHKPQQVGPVTYVGAPYLVDFGDQYCPQVLVSQGKQLDAMPVKLAQKRLVEVEWPKPDWPKLGRGDLLKVRLAIRTKHMAKWGEIREQIRQQVETLGCELYLLQPVVEYQPGGRVAPVERRDDQQLLKAYGRQRSLDEKLMAVGAKLVEEQE